MPLREKEKNLRREGTASDAVCGDGLNTDYKPPEILPPIDGETLPPDVYDEIRRILTFGTVSSQRRVQPSGLINLDNVVIRRGNESTPSLSVDEKFAWIEKAGQLL